MSNLCTEVETGIVKKGRRSAGKGTKKKGGRAEQKQRIKIEEKGGLKIKDILVPKNPV